MSDNNTLPFKMKRFFHRDDYKNGTLTITFTDAAHLADAWNFAEQNGQKAEFEKAIMRLFRVALGAAIPQPASETYGGQAHDAAPGRDSKITIAPDSHNKPSFFWSEEKGMVGGLLWHPSDGTWSIHT
jgi:hypothetical protein